jgi:copper resistance protein C
MKIKKLLTLISLALGLMMIQVGVARAHAFPEKENPGAGQTVATPPSEVKITFDAPIEKLFARLRVIGADGRNEAIGAPVVSDDGRMLTVKVAALKPGGYTVKWAVVCIDTHHTQGSYLFTVAGANP